jgi:hypothetical protein
MSGVILFLASSHPFVLSQPEAMMGTETTNTSALMILIVSFTG